jgi:hypothetical protein
LPVVSSDNASATRALNPIVLENEQPGTLAWHIPQPGFTVADDTQGQIKGYASATSVNLGAAITFRVSVNPAQTFDIDIYRMGWYQGLGGRLMMHVGQLSGSSQPPCPVDTTTGEIECHWADAYTLNVPQDWTSGVYLAVLTNAALFQNDIIFVVKDNVRAADFLYQVPMATYQAYNDYPNDGATGKSLYGYNSFGAVTIAGDTRAVKVSFDRPYAGIGTGQFFLEYPFIRWLEASGYDVVYSTSIDTLAHGRELLDHAAFLNAYHDEYWSEQMYDALDSALASGVHLGFFGANNVYWQVRFKPSSNGTPNRVMVCYKSSRTDPAKGSLNTVLWRSKAVDRPEQTLLGVQFAQAGVADTPYVVQDASSWVYEGTGFSDGDEVQGLVWHEIDDYQPSYPLPDYRSYALLSNSPVPGGGGTSYQNSVIYQTNSSALVFTAGTEGWPRALNDWGDPGFVDPRIQVMTANILNSFT